MFRFSTFAVESTGSLSIESVILLKGPADFRRSARENSTCRSSADRLDTNKSEASVPLYNEAYTPFLFIESSISHFQYGRNSTKTASVTSTSRLDVGLKLAVLHGATCCLLVWRYALSQRAFRLLHEDSIPINVAVA